MPLSRWTSIARKIAKVLFAGCLVSALGAQVSQKQIRYGFPDDWTHHRVRFNTAALRQHPEIAAREPRAAMQLYREYTRVLQPSLAPEQTANLAPSTPHADWSVAFGTGAKVAPDMFPAKWNSDPRVAPDCNTDYVLYGLNVAGVTGGQANLVALNNLYSGASGNPLCGGGQPKILFAYNVTTDPSGTGKIVTSPVLSLDGTKVAFLETVTTGVTANHNTIFHVLNIPSGPTNPPQSFPLSSGAVAPPNGAMTSLSVGALIDSHSSPWVDYPSDTAYFATDNGRLWAVKPVFGPGTPAVVSGFPVVVHQGNGSAMTGPTLDVTGILYIGAANGVLYSVNLNNTPPTIASLPVGGGTVNPSILDAPLLDSVGGSVFAIASNSTNAVVVQASTSLTVKSTVTIGAGSAGGASVNLYDGDFDNNFTTPSSGHLLVCGTGPTNTMPYRYRLPFDTSGKLAPDPAPVQLSTDTTARCGPVTDFFNANIGGGTDFLFWSVTKSCLTGVNGCVMSLVNGAPGLTSARQVGGASGIIVDNNSLAGQASSIYFSTEGGTQAAVKLTQQNLN